MVGIISNSAALFAQRNLDVASSQSESSIAKLSSGKRIISASDDVSGLAIGTVLQTTVSTLRTVLGSTSQAQSLLNIADGGLQNIGDILQRQKSLAVQANTGSLSDNERAFLQQEFSNLTSEIDRLVTNTNFNGVTLLDGSVSGVATVTTDVPDALADFTTSAGGGALSSTVLDTTFDADGIRINGEQDTEGQKLNAVVNFSGTVANADTFTFEGDTITFGVGVGQADFTNGIAEGIRNLAEELNQLGSAASSQFTFYAEGNNLRIETINNVDATGNLLSGATVSSIDVNFSDAANGDAVVALNSTATNVIGGQSIDTTIGTTGANGLGSTDGVADTFAGGGTTFNSLFQGGLSNFSANYLAGTAGASPVYNAVSFSVEIGGETYVSNEVTLTGGSVTNAGVASGSGDNGLGNVLEANTQLTFRRIGAALTEVSFTLEVAATDQTIDNATDATTIATAIQTTFTNSNFLINQDREISTLDVTSTSGTVIDGIAAADVELRADNFATDDTFGNIGSFNIDRVNHTVSVTINDEVYTADLTDAGGYTGTYTSGTNTLTTDGTIILSSADTTDGRQLRIDLNAGVTVTTIQFNDATGEANLESALNGLFAVGGGDGLSFQVGTSASDTIGVSLASAQTSDIFVDANGTTVTLDISTAGAASADNGGDGTGAILASNVLDRAINSITSLRATIGALQSRFDFAASNLTSSIQNTEAARSGFLDVDIAAESTDFATAQVRLQASISVLAQANQVPQNLLKLIG